MSDYVLPTRRALMATMKVDSGITALVPAGSIYGGTVPAERSYPFTRVSSVIATPFRASGLNSSAFRISVSAFTQGVRVDSDDLESALAVTAEDHAMQIGSAIKDGLDDTTITLDSGLKLRLGWVRNIVMIDGDDPSAWMASCIFTGSVAG